MSKMQSSKTVFICTQCGVEHAKWLGKCTDCGSWNTLIEEHKTSTKEKSYDLSAQNIKLTPLTLVQNDNVKRTVSGSSEFDRVLGGGLVAGSLVLLSGDPGIGKSTLILQVVYAFAKQNLKILYASGEENSSQIKLRAARLGTLHENIFMTNENNIRALLQACTQNKIDILVIDSIQTMFDENISGSPGSVTQIRECTNTLMSFAKKENISTLVVGHVTKEGTVAGPKILEHLVDTVIHLEGDSTNGYRILRCLKNRFGSTGELGVFAMQNDGLVDIQNPSRLFLQNENYKPHEGSTLTVAMEGTRPLLLELQVLVGKTNFNFPRRVATGLDLNRFHILLAVLEKHAGLFLSQSDIYANITGGFKIMETTYDLALSFAVFSSLFKKNFSEQTAFLGEVGLSGEIRPVSHIVARVLECARSGCQRIFIPSQNYVVEKNTLTKGLESFEKNVFIIPVEHVNEITQLL